MRPVFSAQGSMLRATVALWVLVSSLLCVDGVSADAHLVSAHEHHGGLHGGDHHADPPTTIATAAAHPECRDGMAPAITEPCNPGIVLGLAGAIDAGGAGRGGLGAGTRPLALSRTGPPPHPSLAASPLRT
jgi:hypothetical protein